MFFISIPTLLREELAFSMSGSIRVLCLTTDGELSTQLTTCFSQGEWNFDIEIIPALAALSNNSPTDFDCVLLDLDGTADPNDSLIERFRDISPTAFVLALTNDETDIETVQTLGAQDYFPKQSSPEAYTILRQRLEKLFGAEDNHRKEVQEVKERFMAYVENASDLITVLDEQMQVKYQSPAAKRIIGYEQEALFGEDVIQYVHPDDRERCVQQFSSMVTEPGKTTEEVQYRFKHADGSWVWLESVGSNKTTSAVDGYVINSRDISERKKRQREIKESQRELAMLKQVFSRVFRHNIRNELTVLQGQINLITERTDDESINQCTTTALESADKLLDYVQKARQIERVIEKEPVTVSRSVPELIETAVTPFHNPDAAVMIQTDIDSVSVRVIEEFEIAIENAIENAIEHNTPPVTVEITTELTDETVTVCVTDDGEGIPRKEISVLLEEEETQLNHGSGVGLWLIKWYTKKSDGTLDITQTDNGTQVRMELPRA